MLTRRSLLTASAALLPAAARAPELNFLVVGDWGREGADKQREVGAQMGRTAEATRSRFVISVGDNFYENGVTGLADPQWRDSFEAIYAAPSLQIPWHVILGNHDYRGNVQAQLDYTRHSRRWRMPARHFQRRETLPDGTTADLFFLDTSPFLEKYRFTKVNILGQDTDAQLAWLDAALARSTAAWKIVIGHHPVRTVLRQHRDTKELVTRLQPLLVKHRVPVYLNGHDHNLQLRRDAGTAFITSGAGSLTNRVKAAGDGEFASDQHGFMTVSLSRDAFRYRFVSETGAVLFQDSVLRI